MPPEVGGDGVARLELGAVAPEDLALGGPLRIVHVDAQHEAVELRLRQWIGAFELARVLRREHQEILGQRIHVALRGDLALFHRLEQRRLGLGSGAVDFVHQQHVGEQRAAAEHELVLRRVEDVRADDVARHEIRGALHAFEFSAEHSRERLGEQGLAETGRTLHQHVAARDQRDTQRADHVFGADDDARELALHGLFEGCDCGVHVFSRVSRVSRRFCSGTSGSLRSACASAYQVLRRSSSCGRIAACRSSQCHSSPRSDVGIARAPRARARRAQRNDRTARSAV